MRRSSKPSSSPKSEIDRFVRGEALRAAVEKTCSPRKLRLTEARRTQIAAEVRLDVLQTRVDGALTAERAVDIFGRIDA